MHAMDPKYIQKQYNMECLKKKIKNSSFFENKKKIEL
jgi:hypothetical protein